MTILYMTIYRFNSILTKPPIVFFTEVEYGNLNFVQKHKRPQFPNTKWQTRFQKGANELNRHYFFQRHTTNAHMNRWWKSLIIRKIQIKISEWYHITPFRMAIIKNKAINVDEDLEKRESYCNFVYKVNWYNHYRK